MMLRRVVCALGHGDGESRGVIDDLVVISPPWRSTGVAAPIDVAGAIVATWAAMAIKVPAESARAPSGLT